MAKAIAEQSNSLSIFWLKKQKGFVPKQFGGGIRCGTVNWTFGLSKNSISYTTTITTGEEDNIRLYYTHTDRLSGEKEELDYKIPLATTPCNYGGVRYWFICPLYKNGQYCGRRVGVIYSVGKYFGCRHCGEIAYAKQMEGGKFRWNGVSIPDIERAEKEVKRYYYKGKPTRKHRRLIRLNDKFGEGLLAMNARLGKLI